MRIVCQQTILKKYHALFFIFEKAAKGVRALRGKFGPLWSQKLKDAFHQFHPIGLLEEWFKCKILALFKLYGCYGNKYGRQNRS